MSDSSEMTDQVFGGEQDTKLYQLLDSLSSGIFLVNSQLLVTYLNSYGESCFQKLCGDEYTQEALLDHPSLSELKRNIVEVFDSRSVDRAELAFTNEDGEQVWLGFTLTCPESEDDMPSVVFGVFKDITNFKSLEQRQGWDNGLRSISLLASGIAQEFHELFGSLSGYLDLYYKDKNAEQKLITAVEDTVEKGLGIVNKLHNFTVDGKGRSARSDLIVSVMHVVSLLESELNRRGIVCNTSFQSSGQVLVPSDVMKKILLDLMTNSVHSVAELGSIDIRVHSDQDGHEILELKDSGRGLTEEELQNLFTPFFSSKSIENIHSDSSTRIDGLGLFLVYSMVREYGGDISVESTDEETTLFRLKLPAFQK